MPTDNITEERAARRFHQMARLEREIAQTTKALDDCKAEAKVLLEARAGLITRLRRAARDEGDLPLFDL